MRLIYSLVFVLTIYSVLSYTQEIKTITIQDAVNLAIENNIQLRKQKYELQKIEGITSKAGVLPNPEASFYSEELSNDLLEYNEWTLAGTLPVNFIWDRWSAVNSSSALYEAELKNFEQIGLEVTTKVRSAFVRYHFIKKMNDGWQNALQLIEKAKQTALAREEEGEISGYDKQRIQLEYLLYKKNETDSRIALQDAAKELSLLIFPMETIAEFNTDFSQIDYFTIPDLEILQNIARENRSDLQYLNLLLQSKSSQLSNEQLKIIPDLSVTLGYKKQSDDLGGLVYGLNLGIPLFNRNRGNIEIVEAELNQQKLDVESIGREIEYEVINSHNSLLEYTNQLRTIEEYDFLSTNDIINIAEYSYEEGEMSLLEMIDALRAYTDAFKLKNELLINYYNSYFQLELAVGKEFNQ
ncbi:MAG: TolC family protein [Ignavibacteria bacterium]|nr:TolC family protein [Ignavibacteria bacterium]